MATKKTEAKPDMIKITLKCSTIGCLDKQIKTVQALGLKKIGTSVIKRDNAAMRGMIHLVKHLVEVEPA